MPLGISLPGVLLTLALLPPALPGVLLTPVSAPFPRVEAPLRGIFFSYNDCGCLNMWRQVKNKEREKTKNASCSSEQGDEKARCGELRRLPGFDAPIYRCGSRALE